MVLRALGVMVLMAVPPAAEPPPKVDARAECLKRCAGAPKDATGARLLACLSTCETPVVKRVEAPDAGL